MTRMLSAPPGWGFRPYVDPKTGNWKEVPNAGCFPLKRFNDAKRLCAWWGCEFEFRFPPPGAPYGGGFRSGDGPGVKKGPALNDLPAIPRLIWIDVPADQDGTRFLSHRTFVTTLAHEIAHAVQWRFYGHPGEHLAGYGRRLSAQVAFEQEACRLAFHVWKELLICDKCDDLTPKDFDDYRTRRSHKYILKNWPGMVDDLDPKFRNPPGKGILDPSRKIGAGTKRR